jgi:hypothetical protein
LLDAHASPAHALLVGNTKEDTMRHLAAVLALLAFAGGCANVRTALTGGADDTVYAAPSPDLVGTWRGIAFAVGGDLYHISRSVELTIRPDGTGSWSSGGEVQGTGRVASRGADVVLSEDWARKGNTISTNAAAETIQLKRRGDSELWGVTRAFIPDAQNAIDLKKVAP